MDSPAAERIASEALNEISHEVSDDQQSRSSRRTSNDSRYQAHAARTAAHVLTNEELTECTGAALNGLATGTQGELSNGPIILPGATHEVYGNGDVVAEDENEEIIYERPHTELLELRHQHKKVRSENDQLLSRLRSSAADELRRVMQTARRTFKCHSCNRTYAKQDSLAVHMRLSHSGNPHEAGHKRVSTIEIDKKLERSSDWMPRFKHVLPCTSTMNAVCGGINNLLGSFFVVGGADKRVTLRSLDAKMDMKILYSISCNSTVNAIAVSQDGSTLAYGLRSGAVVLRDLLSRNAVPQLPLRDARQGRVCSIWLSSDATRLVLCTDKRLETWGKGGWRNRNEDGMFFKSFNRVSGHRLSESDSATQKSLETPRRMATFTSESERQNNDPNGWQLLYTFDTPNITTRFSGQHSICGIVSSVSWKHGLKKGEVLMALGERDSVTLWCLETGEVQAELLDVEQTCNCVWLSPDATLLATAGRSNKIMVWGLPDLALVHVFPASSRVWALWGNSRFLASAGSDNIVTLWSTETGAVLSKMQRPGHVHALWGPIDGELSGELLLSAGKAMEGKDAAWLKNGRAHHLENGSVVARYLRSKQVLFQFEGLHDGDTKCMWSDGKMLAWAGLEFVSIIGVESGRIIADFSIKTIVTGVWCCELEGSWVIAIAFQKYVIVLNIETGQPVTEWYFPGTVNAIAGHTHRRMLIVGGMWDGLCICSLAEPSAPPVHIGTFWQNIIGKGPFGNVLSPRLLGHTQEPQTPGHPKRGAPAAVPVKVRCIWISRNATLIAYAIENVTIVRSVEDDSANAEYISLHSKDMVSCIWGSKVLIFAFVYEYFTFTVPIQSTECRRPAILVMLCIEPRVRTSKTKMCPQVFCE